MRIKILQAICLATAALGSNVSVADIVALPGGGYTVAVAEFSPRRGSNEGEVLRQFGEPVHRNRPVGSPAISSWEYLEFEVYFENGVVIHAVHKSS